jgi:hypothetical protein
MTIKSYFDKITVKQIMFFIFGIWLLDFTSTVIALNFFDNIMEANKIANYFYSHGLWGWIIDFIFTFILLFYLSYFLRKVQDWCKKQIKPGEKDISWIVSFSAILLFVICETYIIIHNIGVML